MEEYIMAIVYDKNINKHTDWDGDQSTSGKPVSGRAVQEFIKRSLNSKIGYIYEDTKRNRFLGFADEEDYNKWVKEGSFLFSNLIISQWNNSKEQGIPIYTKEYADSLVDADPNNYIVIPDESDITNSEVKDKTYDTSINGPLANILFSAIRQLQSEIAKIKNTFNYGLYSYTGTNTAMSKVVGDYSDEEEEPLWAVDEDSLSFITELTMNVNNELTPQENVIIDNELLRINSEGASWRPLNDIEIPDSKTFIYITSSNKNITVDLFNSHGSFQLDLSSLETPLLNLYNILIVISKKVEIDEELYGDNYIWISISNPQTNTTIAEGYYNGTSLQQNICYTDKEYIISSINFRDITLNKCKIYSKYQDFSKQIIPSQPTDSKYSYKVAHITIRSVDTYNTLDKIKNQLPENELIFIEDTKRLYIKNNFDLVPISASGGNNGGNNQGMDRDEILQMLEEMGITTDDSGKMQFSDITFVHQETGIKFNLNIDSEGNVRTTEIQDETLQDKITKAFNSNSIGNESSFRGFIGRLKSKEYFNTQSSTNYNSDVKLNSDRLKIGAFYAPALTNNVFGCSHCFVELENTSDSDIPLTGCYLHYLKGTSENNTIKHLALTGTIPAGGTYLIRGAKKAEFDDPNTFIKVTTFDQEWYEDGELIDFSHNGIVIPSGSDYIGQEGGAFALTYGKEDLVYSDRLWEANPQTNDSAKVLYPPYYIDSIVYNRDFQDGGGTSYWTIKSDSSKAGSIMSYIKDQKFPDCIYRNTFELDPAKQAFQSLNGYDSSRYRHANVADYQYLYLGKEFIEFPHSEEKCPVSKFTPKASFEHKNVCTDKTQLDTEKPNMVTCSFGKNPYTTRCFNWVSGGLFDEYVFIKDQNDSTIWHKFESYKEGDESKTQESGSLQRKEFNNADIINCIYKRITGRFPAANTIYTAHKCIINITETAVISPTTYTYIVGRADKNGNPDFEHCSEEYTFTLYPTSYIPRIYQTTDQQGFHWIEYQVWAAAANVLNEQIISETTQSNIIPVLVNTGDMTQSGARINEWLDYYNAGKPLFKHLEQMNVVGNNDLCGNDFTILGTGDDEGKANSYYFHVFYCYEVETEEGMIPIINNKYIPSLYRIMFNTQMLLFVNSEITIKNCSGWFGTINDNIPVNVYTGWEVKNDKANSNYMANILNFTPIYTMLYHMTENLSTPFIAICHEMPFTVITKENVSTLQNCLVAGESRSLSGKSTEGSSRSYSLVGSHLNQISKDDKVGIYWFSRLLEYRGCKLCIGGHKHTYASTYPVMENYIYTENEVEKRSSVDGPMTMTETLENDKTTIWNDTKNGVEVDLSKFPLTLREAPLEEIGGEQIRRESYDFSNTNTYFYPSEFVNPSTGFINNNSGIVYFMCQATGFKLMSNKELPSQNQTFSQYIPKSNESTGKATGTQRYPMYSIIKIGENSHNYEIQLIRLQNIQVSPTNLFTQVLHGTSNIVKHYLYDNSSTTDVNDAGDKDTKEWKYGGWTTTPTTVITI